MIIAFCTACMNRRWQLEQTLPWNLSVLRSTPHFLALCNYNSRDGLDELVASQFSADCDRGPLLYFRTQEPDTFHSSMAKNAAHRVALRREPDVLFNLDADNFVTDETIELVERVFSHDMDTSLHNWSRSWPDGSSGRIAVSRHNWVELGGYDETLLAVGWQDVGFLFRCWAAGMPYLLRGDGIREPVQNTIDHKLENVDKSLADANGGSAFDALRGMVTQNLVRTLERPMRLDHGDQRRFRGILNFGTQIVV